MSCGNSRSSKCNPCGPSEAALNEIVNRAAYYARIAKYSLDEFTRIYLGAKDTAPTTDNEGQPLQEGALYFNTVSNILFVWNGTSWTAIDDDEIYLGGFSVAPTLNNQGLPLQLGNLYWNTGSNNLWAYNGSTWIRTNFNETTPFLSTGSTTARTLANRFADVVNVLDFGADPTGAVNSTTNIQNAINSLGVNGGIVFGEDNTYRVDNAITVPSNVTLKNFNIDISDSTITTNFYPFIVSGVTGTPIALTSNLNEGGIIVSVSNTATFSKNQYVYIGSNRINDSIQNSRYGQIAQVLSVDSSTQLTLHAGVRYAFATTDSSTIAPLTTVDNVTFDNVNVVGNANPAFRQGAVNATCAKKLTIKNCSFSYYSYRGLGINRCIDTVIDNCSFSYVYDNAGTLGASGLSYGVGIGQGSVGTSISNCFGNDLRHLVTIGDVDGISAFTTVSNCTALNCRDAGYDSHAASDYTTFSNNHCEASSPDGITKEGIILQGRHSVITGNNVKGFKNGIRVQSLTLNEPFSTVISNNLIDGIDDNGSAILIDTVGSANLSNVEGSVISNNSIIGRHGVAIGIWNLGDSDIINTSITGNSATGYLDTYGVWFRSNASGKTGRIIDTSIVGNCLKLRSGSTGSSIRAQGSSTAYVFNILVQGNHLRYGNYNIDLDYFGGFIESGNFYQSFATDIINYTNFGGGRFLVDPTTRKNIITTSSTSTIDYLTRSLTVSFAGTHVVTLPNPVYAEGSEIYIRTVTANGIDSASNNVVQITGTGASNFICGATDGAWALLRSDGTNWVTIATSFI